MQSSTSCGGIALVGVVQVVGGQQGQAEVAGQGDQLGVDPALLGQAVLVQLDEVVAGPEQVAELGQGGGRALAVALEQRWLTSEPRQPEVAISPSP